MQELAYRWLFSITKSFAEYNGVVPEKFDVVDVSHLVHVEYGNVGVDFKYVDECELPNRLATSQPKVKAIAGCPDAPRPIVSLII